MKFSCEKYLLQAAIVTASRCVASKSPIPALEGLLIDASSDVKITGYDLKKGIYTSFPADVAESGSAVLPARIFGEIVRSLPDGIVTISTDYNLNTKISCESSEFNIIGSDPGEYPELPTVDRQSYICLPQKIMSQMIRQTIFAISDNESRPVYTGALFEVNGDKLTVVTVDGFRLALRRESVNISEVEDCSFIVPGNALTDLEKICVDPDEKVDITIGSRHISFIVGDTVLVSRRLEGEFMNYKKNIPTDFPIEIKAQREDLLKIVSRVGLIIDEKTKNPVRMSFDENKIKFLCITGVGRAEDECVVEGSGNGLEIGFNNRYLSDALKAAPAQAIKIGLINGASPCVIYPAEGEDSFAYMILPVRLKAGA